MVTVRITDVNDHGALLSLASRFPQPKWPVSSAELFRECLQRCIADPLCCSLVAEEKLGLVGYLNGIDRRRYHSDESVAQALELFVAENRRGEGIGRSLMTRFEAWARERGCTHAILGGPVPEFYQALGYQRAGLFFGKAL